MWFVPVDGKLTELVKTIVVVESLIAPFKVVVSALATVPPKEARPQPKPGIGTASPKEC